MADRLTVKVNYILDAQNKGKFNSYKIFHKNFENWTKNIIDKGNYVKNLPILSFFNTKVPQNRTEDMG